MRVPPGLERVVSELEPGGRLVGVEELTGGVSANVYAVDIRTSDGISRRVVCRQHPEVEFKQHGTEVAAKEYRLLQVLHQSALAVPQPYLYVEPPDTAPILVMEWVDESTEPDGDDLAGSMDEMARFLVQLHALDPTSLPLPGLEVIEDPFEAIVAYLPPTAAGRTVETWLASDGAERRLNDPALLHGDYWPGNVLWRAGRLRAVIDWEDARLGDPLADLATARVELLCQYGPEAMTLFTERYLDLYRETIGPLPLGSLSIWELYTSAAALATMGAWGLEPDEEARRRARTQEFFDRAADQLDV